MAIVSFSLDDETISALAKMQSDLNFKNRSDVVRMSVRALTDEIDSLDKLGGLITSVAIIVHSKKHDSEVDELKHEFDDVIATQVHNFFSGKCVEIFVLHGSAQRIVKFAKSLKTKKHLEYAKLVNPHSTHKH